jgi:methionyl-tRNA synthetase
MKFYVTTPIYYVNDRPHIGHVYTTTIADIFARYHRLCGDEVFFLTGTDEHAAKVVDSAAKNNMTTQQWADRNAQAFQETFTRYGVSNDDFIRTSQQRHKDKVQEYVTELMKTGDVYLGDYEGWYDAGQEEYIPETKAKEYGYVSPFNGKPLVRKTEKNYFFRLSKYSDALLKLFADQPHFCRPEIRRNEITNRIKEGLNDVPISRTGGTEWGILVPGDTEHVIYVWIDALFNYLSTIDTPERRGFWPATVHLIAKDILWFHAVIWPAMLMALKRPLPGQVYAHSFWIAEGQKMSKSLGNFVDLEKMDKYIADYGLDAFRFYLASNGPMGINDSDFADARFREVYNADLANNLGNLVNRTLNMITRYRQAVVPRGNDTELRAEAEKATAAYCQFMDNLDLTAAVDAVRAYMTRANQFIEQTAPFKMAKDPAQAEKLNDVLYALAETARLLSILIAPIMPERAAMIRSQLGLADAPGNLREELAWGRLASGTKLGEVKPLFPRKE